MATATTELEKKERLMQDAVDDALPGSFTMFKNDGCVAMQIMGDIYPGFIDENTIKYLTQNHKTKANDVFIITYPKSGTTWLQKICVEIMNQQKSTKIELFKDGNWRHIVWMEAYFAQHGLNKFNKYIKQFDTSLCFWKTHAPFHLFPAQQIHSETKLIVVCRNPKDTVVSAYKFFSIEPASRFEGDFNSYFKYWMMGMIIFGNWFEYYSEWWRIYKYKKIKNNILWVYYEDLKNNPLGEIEKIAKYLGKYQNLGDNEQERKLKIEQIAEKSSFKNMKLMTETGKVDIGVGSKFFRKGIIGDWDNFMSQEQSDTVDQMIRCKFYETDFKYYVDLKKQSSQPNMPLKAKL